MYIIIGHQAICALFEHVIMENLFYMIVLSRQIMFDFGNACPLLSALITEDILGIFCLFIITYYTRKACPVHKKVRI